MEQWRGRVAVVTGASSGIGEAIAETLTDHGMTVVALARREDRLQALKKKTEGMAGKLYTLKTDLTVKDDIHAALKWIDDNLGPIHVLINNAGAIKQNFFHETETEDWESIFRLNVLALSILSKETLKSIFNNNTETGHIINISSIAGDTSHPMPKGIFYFATKRAVNAISEGLRCELAAARPKSKIKITNISPGLVQTEVLGDFPIPSELPILKPKDIADGVVYALSTPPHLQVSQLTLQPVGESIYTLFSMSEKPPSE